MNRSDLLDTYYINKVDHRLIKIKGYSERAKIIYFHSYKYKRNRRMVFEALRLFWRKAEENRDSSIWRINETN